MNTNSIKDLKCPLSFEEKLELADWIAETSRLYGIGITLTGSMLLKKLGIIDREPQDIDFTILIHQDSDRIPLPPFSREEPDDGNGYKVLKRFSWLGAKVEILYNEGLSDEVFFNDSEETQIEIVENILKAKKFYLETETRPDQIAKHTEDIPKIEQWLATKRTKQC